MDKVLDSALPSSANKRKGILAIGAHPDDIELGCGASLARLAQKGIYIAAVVMTTGNSGTDGIIDRHEESRNALKILGGATKLFILILLTPALIYSSMI